MRLAFLKNLLGFLLTVFLIAFKMNTTIARTIRITKKIQIAFSILIFPKIECGLSYWKGFWLLTEFWGFDCVLFYQKFLMIRKNESLKTWNVKNRLRIVTQFEIVEIRRRQCCLDFDTIKIRRSSSESLIIYYRW